MTPLDQKYLKGNAEGISGDCLRACVASILELPLEEVPHFVEEHQNGILAMHDWLFTRGIDCLALKGHYDVSTHVIFTGLSPRSTHGRHAVVGLAGEIVHDPHPDRTGLRGLAEHTYIFLPVEFDWSKHRSP